MRTKNNLEKIIYIFLRGHFNVKSIIGISAFLNLSKFISALSKFQSEEVIETELIRGEQLMNLIERFDKFACSDSDDE